MKFFFIMYLTLCTGLVFGMNVKKIINFDKPIDPKEVEKFISNLFSDTSTPEKIYKKNKHRHEITCFEPGCMFTFHGKEKSHLMQSLIAHIIMKHDPEKRNFIKKYTNKNPLYIKCPECNDIFQTETKRGFSATGFIRHIGFKHMKELHDKVKTYVNEHATKYIIEFHAKV